MFEKIRDFLPNTFRQLIKYGVVGILNVIIYFAIDYLLSNYIDYFRNHIIQTNIVASVLSFLNGLYFNRKWTFKSDRHWIRDSIYILSIFGVCLFVQSSVIASFVLYFKSQHQYLQSEYLLFSKICGVVVFATLNFGLNKYVTFRVKKTKTEIETQ